MKAFALRFVVPFFTVGTVLALCFFAVGCVAPWHLFSRDRSKPLAKAQASAESARGDVLRAAQAETVLADAALKSAPLSRPVEIARDATAAAVGLHAEALGALPESERVRIVGVVADLASDDPARRAVGEAARTADAAERVKLSAALAAAESRVKSAEEKLAVAYGREKALADDLRALSRWLFVAVVVAILAAVGWVYVRFTLGGIAPAVGRMLGHLDTSNPTLAETVRGLLDAHLDRGEQAAVRRHA